MFSNMAIVRVIFSCYCAVLATWFVSLFSTFSFNSDRICFRCSQGLVSFCCLFAG